MRIRKIIVLLMVLFSTTIFCVAQSQLRIEKIDSILTVMSESHQFNGSILIASENNILLDKQYGFIDCTFKNKLTKETAFHLASVGKPITAISILILFEHGLIDLDAAITDYLPELKYNTVKVRNLLNHTSGVSDYIALYENIWPDSIPITNDLLLNDFAKNDYPLEFQPGSKYSYTSTNYDLLACIIERVTNSKFPDFVSDSIFKPLGMNNSFVLTPIMKTKNEAAIPFENDYGEFKAINSFPWATYGGHGIYSTTDDLFKLDQALFTEKLLKKITTNESYKPTILNDSSISYYGFGWEIDSNIVFHAGGWMGFRAQFNRDLKNRHTFILLDNSNNRDWIEIVEMIENILNDQPYSIPTCKIGKKLEQGELQKYIGVYELREDYLISIKLENDKLFIYIPGRESMELCSESKESFFLKEINKNTSFEFIFDNNKEVVKMIINQGESKIETQKLSNNER